MIFFIMLNPPPKKQGGLKKKNWLHKRLILYENEKNSVTEFLLVKIKTTLFKYHELLKITLKLFFKFFAEIAFS